MCAEFYIAWAGLLEQFGNYRKTASVFAHGLRAGCQSILCLEDQIENFVARYRFHCLRLTDEQLAESNLFGYTNEKSINPNQPSSDGNRQKLASLKLIETADENSNVKFKAPVYRTNEMWHREFYFVFFCLNYFLIFIC